MKARLLRAAKNKRVTYQKIPIVIEYPEGSTRNGKSSDGTPWERRMLCDYGYIEESIAKGDGEAVDVYLADGDSDTVYAIEQLKDGEFDEVKLMMGFPSEESALNMYLKHYPEGWERNVGRIQDFSIDEIKEWLDGADQ